MENIEVKIKLVDLIAIQEMAKLYEFVGKERDEYREKYEKLLIEKKN